eukprot:752019-Hanusia_phi.AAC.2
MLMLLPREDWADGRKFERHLCPLAEGLESLHGHMPLLLERQSDPIQRAVAGLLAPLFPVLHVWDVCEGVGGGGDVRGRVAAQINSDPSLLLVRVDGMVEEKRVSLVCPDRLLLRRLEVEHEDSCPVPSTCSPPSAPLERRHEASLQEGTWGHPERAEDQDHLSCLRESKRMNVGDLSCPQPDAPHHLPPQLVIRPHDQSPVPPEHVELEEVVDAASCLGARQRVRGAEQKHPPQLRHSVAVPLVHPPPCLQRLHVELHGHRGIRNRNPWAQLTAQLVDIDRRIVEGVGVEEGQHLLQLAQRRIGGADTDGRRHVLPQLDHAVMPLRAEELCRVPDLSLPHLKLGQLS